MSRSRDNSAQNAAQLRIVVIGPVLPFRGGISQHTTLLARALAASDDCHIFSFKRLYPQWLFPGQTDRDPDYEGYQEPGTEYFLDSLNPLTWYRASQKARALQPDFVLLPWWTFFLGPLFAYLTSSLLRSGIDVVFFCHNVLDHEQAWWKRALTKLVLRQGSRFVVHSRVDEARLKEIIPGASVAVHPHPIYHQFPEPMHTLPRRAGLELLFYGFVRPYKGLEFLIEAMGMLKDQNVFLTVAGEFWAGEKQIRDRISALGLYNKVEIRSRYHSDRETAELFDRTDAVVLPYLSATGSGVVPIAYHYGRPVLLTDVGGLPDVVLDRQTGWIVPPGDAAALAKVIRGINMTTCQSMRKNIDEFKSTLTWQNLASTVVRRAR